MLPGDQRLKRAVAPKSVSDGSRRAGRLRAVSVSAWARMMSGQGGGRY